MSTGKWPNNSIPRAPVRRKKDIVLRPLVLIANAEGVMVHPKTGLAPYSWDRGVKKAGAK